MRDGEIIVVTVVTVVWLLTLIFALGTKSREERR